MKYYKAMNKDFTCRGFQYEIGKTYELPKSQKLELCENGFHFYEILNDCFWCYKKDDCIVCEVEPLGKIVGKYPNKFATDKIKIIRQLSNEEIEKKKYHIQNGITSIRTNCFYDVCCSEDLKEINIPNSVITIERYAFEDCKYLTKIDIPSSVTTIEYNAFSGCTSLKSINIPNSVTAIDWSTFKNCKSLKSVTIPDSVTTIGTWAFYGCKSLKSVTIPDSVTTIGAWAFCGCNSLQKIYVSKNFDINLLKSQVLKPGNRRNKVVQLLDKVELVTI